MEHNSGHVLVIRLEANDPHKLTSKHIRVRFLWISLKSRNHPLLNANPNETSRSGPSTLRYKKFIRRKKISKTLHIFAGIKIYARSALLFAACRNDVMLAVPVSMYNRVFLFDTCDPSCVSFGMQIRPVYSVEPVSGRFPLGKSATRVQCLHLYVTQT